MLIFNFKNLIYNLDQVLKKINQKKRNIVLYTAIFGDFDNLNEIQNPNPDISYVCFTDKENLLSNTWEIVTCSINHQDPRLAAKFFKIFPHKIFKNTNLSLWVDGNYTVNRNHSKFFNLYKDVKDIMFYKHHLRNCIFEEANHLKNHKPEFNSDIIKHQMKKYTDLGMPGNNGLIHGAIILRNHKSTILKKLMNDWWYEIHNHSIRDQLSFNYVDWKNGNFVEYFPENILDFLYFTFNPHINNKDVGIFFYLKIYIRSIIGKILSYVRNKR